MDTAVVLAIVASAFIGAGLVCILIVVAQGKGNTKPPANNPPPAGGSRLDLNSMAGRNAQVSGDVLRVTYPRGKYASSDGINTSVSVNPTEAATLSYEVYLEPGWCWGGDSKGGKFPGLGYSAGSDVKGGTGGNWIPNGGSYRVMWYGDGFPRAYVYYNKTGPGNSESLADQDPGYKAIAKPYGQAGHNVWPDQLSQFKVGAWNSIVISMKLNTPGKRNGGICLRVNGQEKRYDSMMWRTTSNQLIRKVLVASFHGGGSSDWACSKTTYASFRNFKLIPAYI